ncbi:MAG: ankyrin repeat domain-containing protein [Victivallaceae bacterium]|nr:ankyrin repeat domain-containing protein [Victivallaceae bacterium]
MGRVLGAVLLVTVVVGGWTAIYVVAGNPLPRAAKRGNLMVVRVLLALDFSVDKDDDSGNSALYLAAANDHSWTAQRLIREGADSKLALGQAARKSDQAAAKMLLKLGADPNGDPIRGTVPLLAAAGSFNPGLTAILLDAGADVNREAGNENALHKLEAARIAKMDKYSRNRRNNTDPDCIEVFKLLVEHGINLNAPNLSGQTPLYVAAAAGDSEMVRMLIDAGADLGVKTPEGETAFKAAQRMGYSEICEMLNREAKRRHAAKSDGDSSDWTPEE